MRISLFCALCIAVIVPVSSGGEPLATPSTWGVSDVGEWLFEEGFGVHRTTFAMHSIDGRALLSMREYVLQEVGIDKSA